MKKSIKNLKSFPFKVTLYVCHTKTVVGVVRVHGVVGVIGVALVILVLGWLT